MKRRITERTDSRNLRTLTNKSTTMPNVLKVRDYLKTKQKSKLEGILFSPEQSPDPKRKNESQFSTSPESSNFSTSTTDSPFANFDDNYQIPIPSKPTKKDQICITNSTKFEHFQQLLTAKIHTAAAATSSSSSCSSTEKTKPQQQNLENQTNKKNKRTKQRLNNSESITRDNNNLTTTPIKKNFSVEKQLRTLSRKSKTLLSYQPTTKNSDIFQKYAKFTAGPSSNASCSPTDIIQVTPDSLEKKKNLQFYQPNLKTHETRPSQSDAQLAKRETEFYKSLQPRRLLEWSESKNDFLTLQNYMSSLKVRKYKLKLCPSTLKRHKELEPRMRSILFDWLMEVCDCFGLQRSTFYMAQYYVDAYLSKTGVDQQHQNSSRQTTPLASPADSAVSMESPLLSSITTGHNISCNTTFQADQTQTSDSCFDDLNSPKNTTSKLSSEVGKLRLQLLGITSLFLAAKIEEIDPPRLARFSYITDGACTDEDIQMQEMDLLQTLNWIMNPVTVYDWLRLYLQTTYHYLVKQKSKNGNAASPRVTRASAKMKNGKSGNDVGKKEESPMPTSLSKMEVTGAYIEDVGFNEMVFVQMCQLLDLSILDVNSLKWQPWELAASILYHFSSQNTAKRASNVTMSKLVECVSWLTPMALTLKEAGLESKPSDYSLEEDLPRNYRRVPPSQWYNMQTHNVDTLSLLENVYQKRDEAQKSTSTSESEE